MMLQLPGFRVVEHIGSNEEISIYRLERIEDNLSFIAKTTCDNYAGANMSAVFQYEYEQLLVLKGKGVMEPYRLDMAGDRPVLLLRDFGGMSLKQLMELRRPAMMFSELMAVAVALVESLRKIHLANVILHEITPLSFMVSDDFNDVKIIDIRACSIEGRQPLSGMSSGRADSILPYISPELTGRTGIVPDYHSDFYSTGVVLYEWFAGVLPFQSLNALDMVYYHLATSPEPIYAKNKSIPKIVSDIIMKCLEKMPEARYASAYGIHSDLEECLVQLRVTGKVQPFPLGIRDESERWKLLEGFFGRRSEQEMLLQGLQRISKGAAEIVWVSGEAGIGKTTLVLETLRKAVPAQGRFAMGKFDSGGAPYQVWIQVIQELVNHLLTADRLQVEVWKLKILDALQGNGQLLIDLAPRLKWVIGEQPPVEELPSAEAQTRFHLVLNLFFQLFTGPDQPLVLFLDDLHWADEASMQYLYHLLKDRDTKHLLIVGAFRDNDPSSLYPIEGSMKQLKEIGASMERIRLKAYDRTDLNDMLDPIMHGTANGIDELTGILLHKTDGNPLFLKQFLQDISGRRLVTFDERSRSWKWNTQLIAELSVPENIVASIAGSLKKLSEQTAYVLGRAAFLGKRFDLHTLALITELTVDQTREWVESAVDHRLLQPLSGESDIYIFQHDYIRQSAYELVPEPERMVLHMTIGWLLAERMKAGEDVQIFDVLKHLNRARSIIEQNRQQELAELNLQAGLKAKQTVASEASLEYVRLSTELVGEEGWESCYSLTYQAHMERAELEFQYSHLAKADELFNLLLNQAAAGLDQAQVYIRMIQLEGYKESYQEVIDLGEKAMKLLGVRYRFNPGPVELLQQWARMRWKLRSRPVESFELLPPMKDERHKAAMAVLMNTSHAVFQVNREGWFSLVLTMLELTMDYGMTPEASSGFVGYAILLNYKFKDYEAAYKWGKLACSVSQAKPSMYLQAYTTFSLCYDSWIKYEPGYLRAFSDHAGKAALQSGDLWKINQSVLINCGLLFQFSHPLKDTYSRLINYAPYFQRDRDNLLWKQAAFLSQLFSELTGYRAPDDPFVQTGLDMKLFIKEAEGDADSTLKQFLFVYQYIIGYLFGDYQKAYLALENSWNGSVREAGDFLDTSSYYYYNVLVLKELYRDANKQEKSSYLNRIRLSLKKLRRIAEYSPENYLHKYLLVKAELAKLTHKNRQAEQLYGEAIEAARARGFIHDVGIIAECFAKYGIEFRKPWIAKLYMNEAYEAYQNWGAAAKASELRTKYAYLLQAGQESGMDLERMDYLSVVMSAQALSGEMEMDRLLQMLLRIMLQNAGAEYGALLFEYEQGWMVEAYGTAEKLSIEPIRLDNAENLVPTAIVEYASRTKEEVILHNVASSGLFERDEYIKKKAVKSVLCLPIIHQNKLVCLIYMENNLSTGVFTKERLDVLKLLSSQCAISITNAKLYSGIQYLKNNLEEQVGERTRTLEKFMQASSEALAEMTVYAERNRIAQEIHDIVGHSLTSTILQIEAGKRLLHRDMDSAVVRLQEAQDLVRHSLSEIRNSVHMLKEDRYYDIAEALRLLIHNTERNTGVVIHTSIDPALNLSFIQKKVIYHALQEGLTNGIRHGNSDEFSFSLQAEGDVLQFRLADNGTGASQITMGFGLNMMRDRVEQLKGTLYIASEPSKGCLLRINLPYDA